MKFFKFKRVSPAQKIYLCIATIAAFLIFSFVHIQLIDARLNETITKMDLSGKLLHQAQNLPFNAELILREVPKAKDELEKNLNLYEKHFYTLKSGGLLYFDGIASALTASSGDSREKFQELETIWFEFKANGEVLLNQETFIGGSEMATGIIDEFGNYVAQEVFKSVTPEVRIAINFIEGNSAHFLSLNMAIVDMYDEEVALFIEARRIAMYVDATILLLLILVLLYLFRTTFFANIAKLRFMVSEVADGNLDISINNNLGGEIGAIWQAFGRIVESFKSAVKFIDRIGKGDLDVEYEVKGEDDDFGLALVHMKETMRNAAEDDEKRKVEDDIRSWTTQGIARFGELLRQNTNNINELSYSVVSELIEYVGANQGGVFVLEEDYEGRYFSLAASYAYNRRKYLEKRINWGDTLVGRCAQELKTLYLKEVPEDYLEISSGLGNYRPASLLLCPLKYNDEIYGVIEIASFNELKPHHISFVEKISESIASTISSVRINSRTSKLLEESKEQAERLSQQEEEMRQNMEEMQATQEEASIRTSQLEGIINAIDNTLGTFELDLDGKYINANSNYIRTIHSDIDTLLIQKHVDVVAQFSDNLEGYEDDFKKLLDGDTIKRVFQYQLEDQTLYFLESFTPVYDAYDAISKIIVFATNITESKQNELAVQQSLSRVQEQELMLNENLEKIQETQQLLEEKDERQRNEIAQLNADSDAKVTMLKMREDLNNAIINKSSDGIVVFNKRGEIITINKVLRAWTNYDSENWKSIAEFLPIGDKDVPDAVGTYFEPGKDIFVEKDGKELALHVTVSELKTGVQVVYITYVRDLSNKHKTEAQKDEMLSEALAREVEYKAELDRLKDLSTETEGNEAKATSILEWHDDYSVGYPEIDNQHKRLIGIINQLYLSYKEGKAFIKLQKILNELIDYTSEHFAIEEDLFEKNSYPNSEEHIKYHEQMVQKILDLEKKFQSGDLSVAQEIIEFLRSWLLNHILVEDMKYKGLLGDKLDVGGEGPEKVEVKPLQNSIESGQIAVYGEGKLVHSVQDWVKFVELIVHKYNEGIHKKEFLGVIAELKTLLSESFGMLQTEATDKGIDTAQNLVAEHTYLLEELDHISTKINAGEEEFNLFVDKIIENLNIYLRGALNEALNAIADTTQVVENKTEPSADTNKGIDWEDTLSVGLNTIDDQHKILVDLLNQLQAALVEGRTRKQIKTLLKAAVDYAEYHFSFEERHFNQFSYENTDIHSGEHKSLLTEIKKLQSDYSNTKTQGKLTDSVITSFAKELFDHFKESDRLYVELFKNNGVD